MYLFISFLAGIILFYLFHYFPFSTVVISLISAVYMTAKKKFFLILVLILGIAYAFLRYEPPQDIPHIKDEVAVKGIFESYPVKNDKGTFRQKFTIVSAEDMDTNEKLAILSAKEIVLFSESEFDPATEYVLSIKFLKSRNRLNPGERISDEMYANLKDIYSKGNKGISFQAKVGEYRQRINTYIEENFRKDSGAFVASITTGQRLNMSEELKDAFNATGLAHILSISGTHFGLFSVFLFGIFRFLIKSLPYGILQRLTIYLTPSQAAAIFCIPFMLAYLGLSGASIPAIRSFVMISLFLVGLILGRKGFWLNSLLLAAFILALWEPEWIFSLSFQLSFLAVLFIGFAIHGRDEEKKDDRKFLRYIKNILFMTLSASIGTAPLVAYYFHYFSIISPVSNLVIAPLIGFILIPLSVITSFLFLITGHFFFAPVVSTISDMSISLVKIFSEIPFASVKIAAFPAALILFFYAGFLLYFLLNRRKYLLIIPFVPLIIYLLLCFFEKDNLSVTFLDVGQGDSSVIELPDGKIMVIDTGRTGRETASFLTYCGKKTVDILALSHSHPDHTGGLDYLVRKFDVREIWDNGRTVLPDKFDNLKRYSLGRGDMVEDEGYRIYVLHPYPEFSTINKSEYISANNDSLVLKIEGHHKAILFTGDIEEEAEDDILHLGQWLKSDVMKVPHHGGKTSAYEPFFKAVSPDIAVVSAGRDNAFGHPHQETLRILQDTNIFKTDIDGAIKIQETGKGLEIKTCKDFQLEKANSLHEEVKNMKRLFEKW
jgi:competence protein ComEC